MAIQRPLIVANGRRTILPSGDSVLGASPFHEVCHIAGLQPTLYLDFARQDFRHYSPSTGLREKALSDIVTFTRTSDATYFDAKGVMQTAVSNVPRLDFDPVTGVCRGLLVEESRTNLLTYSEQFDNAAWAKVRTSISANAIVAPDGTMTADKLVEDTQTEQHILYQIYSVVNGATYTYSVYLKAAEWTSFQLQIGSGGPIGTFDLSAVTATTDSGATASAIAHAGNGWYHCSVTGPANSSPAMYMYKTPGSYTGDGTSGIYIWGAQLEQGAFPTSYIPTTTAAATRAADVAVISGTAFSDFYRHASSSILLHWHVDDVSSNSDNRHEFVRFYSASNSVNRSSVRLGYLSGRRIRAYSYNSATGSFEYALDCSVQTSNSGKFALALALSGDCALSESGAIAITDMSGTLGDGYSSVCIGSDGYTTFANGHIASLAYWPARLPNATLQQLTAG